MAWGMSRISWLNGNEWLPNPVAAGAFAWVAHEVCVAAAAAGFAEAAARRGVGVVGGAAVERVGVAHAGAGCVVEAEAGRARDVLRADAPARRGVAPIIGSANAAAVGQADEVA